MLKALIFDLDGTLIDSREDIAGAVNVALGALGLPRLSLETLSTFVGNGAETLVRRSLAAARRKGERADGVPKRCRTGTRPIRPTFSTRRGCTWASPK